MTPRIALACAATFALVTACGVAGDDPRPPSASALERAQATAAAQPAPASMPEPPVQPQATQTPAPAPRSAMPAVEALTDAAITQRITAALQSDPAMKGADVSINTDKGVVVLSGKVQSHEQTGVASAHAQRQDGVLRVDNHLRPEYS
jgi:osmotically-inducible protein OsmY